MWNCKQPPLLSPKMLFGLGTSPHLIPTISPPQLVSLPPVHSMHFRGFFRSLSWATFCWFFLHILPWPPQHCILQMLIPKSQDLQPGALSAPRSREPPALWFCLQDISNSMCPNRTRTSSCVPIGSSRLCHPLILLASLKTQGTYPQLGQHRIFEFTYECEYLLTLSIAKCMCPLAVTLFTIYISII